MSVQFKQKSVSVKERLNALDNHHHDYAYQKLEDKPANRNLLINGDLTFQAILEKMFLLSKKQFYQLFIKY